MGRSEQGRMVLQVVVATTLAWAGAAAAEDIWVCVEVVLQDHAGDDEEQGQVSQTETASAVPAAGAAPDAAQPDGGVFEYEDGYEYGQGPEYEQPPDAGPSSIPDGTVPPPNTPQKPAGIKITSIEKTGATNNTEKKSAGSYIPMGQDPEDYLERLLEYYITHEPGFEAVDDVCEETVHVEMYPLDVGWTVFARYTGTGREERVDQLLPTELSQFAERATLALLYDKPISTTINTENVLKADSKKSKQKIKGTNHFTIGVGTQLRGGWISTLITDEQDGVVGFADEKIRIFAPMLMQLGYRGRFQSWGLEAVAHVAIGTQKKSAYSNPEGGHVDFGGDAGLQLHLVRYKNPRGLVSFYGGAGATFELMWFNVIREASARSGDNSRDQIVSGGIDVDVVLGWEFMRATAVQFYLQAEINVPAYVVQSGTSHGSVDTWFPCATLELGMIF